MKRIYQLYILNLIEESLLERDELYKILNDREVGYQHKVGFSNISIEKSYLSASLIQEVKSSIKIFNPDKLILENQEVGIFIESAFGIDYQYNTFDYYGAKANFARFKKEFQNQTRKKLYIKEIKIDLFKLIQDLEVQQIDYHIKKLTISHYKPTDEVVGKFAPEVKSNQAGLELMEQYTESIQDIELLLFQESESMISISNSCKLKIKCEEKSLNWIVSSIKNLIT